MTAQVPFGRASDGAGARDARASIAQAGSADVVQLCAMSITATSTTATSMKATSVRAAAAGLVLAGGASRRMGADKARLALAGEPLLARALRVLAVRCAPLWVASGAAPRYADLAARHGARELQDAAAWGERPGPLAGLEAGLAALAAEPHAPQRLVVLACDLPRVGGAVVDALLAAAAGADVAFAVAPDGDHPLLGVYGVGCLAAVRAALAAGRRHVTAFLEAPGSALAVRRIPAAELGGDDVLANLNEPVQWEAERRRAEHVHP